VLVPFFARKSNICAYFSTILTKDSKQHTAGADYGENPLKNQKVPLLANILVVAIFALTMTKDSKQH
jgi:hypothetical protein